MATKENANRAHKNGVRVVLATAATVSTLIGAQALAFAGNAEVADQSQIDELAVTTMMQESLPTEFGASPTASLQPAITATPPITNTAKQNVVLTATQTMLAPKQPTVAPPTATTAATKQPTVVPPTATKIQPTATPVTVSQNQPRPRTRSSR
jgi:hypothetical protein